MNDNNMKIGRQVLLKGTCSPRMTINDVVEVSTLRASMGEYGYATKKVDVECRWFDEKGNLHDGTFDPEALDLLPEPKVETPATEPVPPPRSNNDMEF